MKKLFKKLALMVVALLSFSVGSNYTVKEVKAADESVTYTFSNYAAGKQYASNEEHILDENLSVYTTECHFTSELRFIHHLHMMVMQYLSREKILWNLALMLVIRLIH